MSVQTSADRAELAARLAGALENLSEESAYHLRCALDAVETAGVGGTLVIDVPRKSSDHVLVRWLGGLHKIQLELS